MSKVIVSDPSQFIWTEKWRPNKIDDCILPEKTKTIAKGFLEQGRLPHLLFTGSAGTGKTTLAKAMCNEIGADYIVVNASNESGIDTLRTKITQFASTVSFSESKKVIILDEADYLQANSTQPALRNFMEQFAGNCSFILTCNFKNRLIEPIHSRCKTIDFKISAKEKPELAAQFFKRVCSILTAEEVEFDKKVVAEVVNNHFPDFRRCLNELQSYSATGKIDTGILVNMSDESFNELFKSLKDNKFGDMRRWVAQHADEDTSVIFRAMFDKASEKMLSGSLPGFILLLGKYSYQDAFIADKEINMTAFLTEVMMSGVQWK